MTRTPHTETTTLERGPRGPQAEVEGGRARARRGTARGRERAAPQQQRMRRSPSRKAAQLRGPGSSNRSPAFSECVSWSCRLPEAGGKGPPGPGRGRGRRKSAEVCQGSRVSGSGSCKHRLPGAGLPLVPHCALCSPSLGPRVRRVPTVFALTPRPAWVSFCL